MAEYWFRPKKYGFGATPITWQGWAVTLATVLAMVAVTVFLRLHTRSFLGLVGLFAFDALALGVLLVVSRRKTDGEWHWRWGKN
ncbi:MAG TPA: hypothetical protein VHC71_00155 [Hyphomicrobium sp.]|jgi:hypothetical protein|nr:hypothetical protein [Hyphomicrobium sp.]